MIYVILMLICFILLMAIRIPIPFALLISTLVYYFGADLPLNIVIVRLLRSFDSFILLAIPFFVLAGRIMSEAGISDRLVRVSDLVVGRVKGSLAYVNIVVSMFFGGITGTAISDTTAIGSVLIPTMVKKGYSKSFSAAVTAASSTMGPIIPPSLMFIIYGSIAQVSIRDLFLAGAIPGIMVGLAQMTVVKVMANKHDFPRREEKIEFKDDGPKNAILGGGDIAFPLFFSAAIMEHLIIVQNIPKFPNALLYSLISTVTAGIALSLLFYYSKKDKFYPAMPFISAGCLIGYGIIFLIIQI